MQGKGTVGSQQSLENILQIDREFHRLGEQHRQLDARLTAVSSQRYPSGDEQLEEAILKKLKLQLKDRMENILRRHRLVSGGSTLPTLQQD